MKGSRTVTNAENAGTPTGGFGTIGTDAEKLVSANDDRKSLYIQADHDNEGSIYLYWNDAVAEETSYVRLDAGDDYAEDDNGADVYIEGSAAGQKYRYRTT